MTLKEFFKERANRERLSLRTVLKEGMQVIFLAELYKLKEVEDIVFQGGTCIRLIYNGPRYSDDLDFVTPLNKERMAVIFNKVSLGIKEYAPLFFGELKLNGKEVSPKLYRWKMHYLSFDKKEEVSISIELADYPAYTKHLIPLKLPQGFPFIGLVLINAEKEEEILADKIAAFFGRKYYKGKDFFDIWFLRAKGVKIDPDILKKKLMDYSITNKAALEKELIFTEKELKKDLENFLPYTYRMKFSQEGYSSILASVKEALLEVKGFIGKKDE